MIETLENHQSKFQKKPLLGVHFQEGRWYVTRGPFSGAFGIINIILVHRRTCLQEPTLALGIFQLFKEIFEISRFSYFSIISKIFQKKTPRVEAEMRN